MMKKIYTIIILFILFPIGVFASCGSSNCSPSGGGKGVGASATSGSCTGDPCWLGPSSVGGVRVSLYAYKKKGTPVLIGAIDLWSKKIYTPDYITDPLGDRGLEMRHNCSIPNYTNTSNNDGYKDFFKNNFQERTWSDYSWNANYEQYDFFSRISEGTINTWLYDGGTGPDGSGWLENYVFQYMRSGDYETVAKKFGTTRAKIEANLDNLYIVAEMLAEVSVGSYKYAGTVSEIASRQMAPKNVRRLYQDTSFGKIGDLTGAGSDNYIWQVSEPINLDTCSPYQLCGSDQQDRLCYNTNGMAIWYLPDCCPKCIRSCSQSCDEKYQKGTFKHQMCAQGYCNSEGKDDVKGCLNSCTTIDLKEGCTGNGDGECKLEEATSKNRVCSPETDKDDFEEVIAMNSCHDDSTKYNVVNGNVNYSNEGKYTYSGMNYYRITCEENVKFRDLPKMNATAWLNKMNSGTLHLGFTMDYSKNCNIEYKIGNKGKYSWKQEFKGSRLENDIKDTVKAIKTSEEILADLKKKKKTEKNAVILEDIEKDIIVYEKVIEVAEQTKKELLALAPETFKIGNEHGGGVIDARLIVLTQQDYKDQNFLEPTIELSVPSVTEEVSGKYEIVKKQLVLEPVTCRETPVTTSKSTTEICAWREDLKKHITKTTTTFTTNTLFECDSVDANGNATPITATVADSKYSASLSKTLYYELPDTYVLTQSENDGLVFYSQFKDNVKVDFKEAKKQCTDYLNGKEYVLDGEKYRLNDKDATGKCLKRDNLYQFPQFKDKLIVDELTSTTKKLDYKIKVNNIGYCGKKLGGYTYSCSYQFKKDTECIKCSQYEKGTAQYESCYEENCSCEAVCNGNVSCKQKYCPTNCESCGTEKTFYSEVECLETECDPTKMDCCNYDCTKKYAAGSDELYMCQYECCNSQTNGNVQGISQCCYNYCNKVSRGNNEKYNECVKTWCDCPECEGGDEYVYRSININDPFNGRENEEDGVGLNWRGKIGYITEENNSKSKQYYDSSNSFTTNGGNPEYTVDLSSGMIKAVKNNRKIGNEEVNTTYQVTRKSNATESKIHKDTNNEETVDPYCSYLLHDVLETNGILKQNDTAGMRCK